jgi:lactate racemase
MADPDFILNATIRQDGRVAGVFAGDMEMAPMAAVQHVRTFAQIPLSDEYDVVVTHGGLVGVNHYQAEKAVQVAAKAVREGGYLIVVADTTDVDPLGSESYRRMLRLLADTGPDHFVRTICANNWEFVHDQWGVQVWAKLLAKVPAANIFYFSPQTANEDYDLLPSVPPVELLGKGSNPPTEGAAGEDDRVGAGDRVTDFIRAAVARACAESERATGRKARIAYLADGPHGIPVSGT